MPNEGPNGEYPEELEGLAADESPLPPHVIDREKTGERPSKPPKSIPPMRSSLGAPQAALAIITKTVGAAALVTTLAGTVLDRRRHQSPKPPIVSGNGDNSGGSPGTDAGTSGTGGDSGTGGTGGSDSGISGAGGTLQDAEDAGVSDGGMGSPDGEASPVDEPTQPVNQEDLCGRESFDQDLKGKEIPPLNGGNPCEYVTDADGKIHVIGHTLLDTDGKPRDCFINPVFSPYASTKIRGEITGLADQPGKIKLENGKLCVTLMKEQAALDGKTVPHTEAVVVGEASIRVTTQGKVLIKMLEPEYDSNLNRIIHYVAVTAVEGDALVSQDGRDGDIFVRYGDKPKKIPLDIAHQDSAGCVIASAKPGEFDEQKTGLYILGAGAMFMALRRANRRKSARTS